MTSDEVYSLSDSVVQAVIEDLGAKTDGFTAVVILPIPGLGFRVQVMNEDLTNLICRVHGKDLSEVVQDATSEALCLIKASADQMAEDEATIRALIQDDEDDE